MTASPAGADVHVWTVRHDQAASHEEDAGLGVLSDAEVARFSRFTNGRQRRQRLRVRAALRRILSSYLQANPAHLVIRTGVHGKPWVPGLEFNCSHSARLSVVAVSAQPVGVDVEPMGACDQLDAIRGRFVNDFDHAGPGGSGTCTALIDLLRLWVIKEACLKAIGTGLTVDPRELRVGRARAGEVDVCRGPDVLRARELAIPGGHVAAVAACALGTVVFHDEARTGG